MQLNSAERFFWRGRGGTRFSRWKRKWHKRHRAIGAGHHGNDPTGVAVWCFWILPIAGLAMFCRGCPDDHQLWGLTCCDSGFAARLWRLRFDHWIWLKHSISKPLIAAHLGIRHSFRIQLQDTWVTHPKIDHLREMCSPTLTFLFDDMTIFCIYSNVPKDWHVIYYDFTGPWGCIILWGCAFGLLQVYLRFSIAGPELSTDHDLFSPMKFFVVCIHTQQGPYRTFKY
jgi:hypothetical protein